MAIFLTGSTGYIGAHVTANLLRQSRESFSLLVRASGPPDAARRLWRALQLHMDFPEFQGHLRSRLALICGDLQEHHFALGPEDYQRLIHSTDSLVHCAASLNRKSEKSCLNVNLRGTLEVLQLARAAQQHHGLRRFSHVSTVAVAGKRKDEMVQEDCALEWGRSDYDAYARTKKFCEHMLRELLPDVSRLIFRPSIVLGDSRRPATNQFEMVRAFVFLAGLPVLPFCPTDRLDIVPVDFVADAIAALHLSDSPRHEIYHLSSGAASENFQRLTDALAQAQGQSGPLFVPQMETASTHLVNWLAAGAGKIAGLATLLKVFWPYLVWNTVFDNTRIVQELGRAPAPSSQYCYPLLKFSREHNFSYPFRAWPEDQVAAQASPASATPSAPRGYTA